MTKAIKEKNMAYAGKVASFSANTYHPDKKEAEKAYYYQWLRYYFDTENFQLYIKNAIPHFSKHYLSVSKAEIQTKDSLAKTKFLQSISTSIDENYLTKHETLITPLFLFIF